MKELLKIFALIVLSFSISTAFTSCGGDEPDTPNEPDTPVDTPPTDDDEPTHPSDDNGPTKYDIVGKWKMESDNNEIFIIQFDRNGFFYFKVLNSKEDIYGDTYYDGGMWTYNAKSKQWNIQLDGGRYSDFNGSFHISGNKIVNGEYVFDNYTEDDGQQTESGKLAGTKWSTIENGSVWELSFNANGTFTEKLGEGEATTLGYIEYDNKTIWIVPGYTMLYNYIGNDPCKFEFKSNNTKLTFSVNRYEIITFTRVQ